MLKDGNANWTNFDQIKLSTVVQAISATKKDLRIKCEK
jgi:hypothetical protein